MASHKLYEAALEQIQKIDSEKLRKEAMMLLMEQMQAAGEAPEKVREFLFGFNAPEGLWNQPQEQPRVSFTSLLGEDLNNSGFANNLRQVSEIFCDFCGRPHIYKRLLEWGLDDDALEEAADLTRLGRKLLAFSEIALQMAKKNRSEDGETILQYCLQQCPEIEDYAERARVLAEVALVQARIGQSAEAHEVMARAALLADQIAEGPNRIYALGQIALCEIQAGFTEQGGIHFERALEIMNSMGFEEQLEQVISILKEFIAINEIDFGIRALRNAFQAAASARDHDEGWKVFYKFRHLKAAPKWLILAMIGLCDDLDMEMASLALWNITDLASCNQQWDLAAMAAAKMADPEQKRSTMSVLQKKLLAADIAREELARLLETAWDDLSASRSEEGSSLVQVSLLLKAGLAPKAKDLLKTMLVRNLEDQASPCEKELHEMEEMIVQSKNSLGSAVPWALSFRPVSLPEAWQQFPAGGETINESWNRIFSSIIENPGMTERWRDLETFFWHVPKEFSDTYVNILVYHPLLLRLPAIFALTRRAIAEQNRACIRLAIPLAYDCRDGVEICRLALGAVPAIS